MTEETTASTTEIAQRPAPDIRVRDITAADIQSALKAGMADFKTRPVMGGLFGLFFAVAGLFFLWGLVWFGQIWMVLPAAVCFPLVAPFAASGLYEMSRRMEAGENFKWSDIFSTMARQSRREMGWMAFVSLFLAWVWFYQFRTIMVIVLQHTSFSDMSGFLDVVFFTQQGWIFLMIGTAVGAFLACVVFSITVISMPLLLDQDVDFVTAMITSVRTVTTSPKVMLGWGMIVSAAIFGSLLLGFVGLIVALPILGHTTWHLYRRAIVVPAGTQNNNSPA